MSYERALNTLRLQNSDRVAHLEILDHPRFMQELIGYDPWTDPVQAYVDSYRALDIDWIIYIPRRAVRFARGQSSRTESDGTTYTEWGLSGSYWRREYLFQDVESVLAFDPVGNEQGEELVTPGYNQRVLDARRADQELMRESAIVSGIYYTTLFQFCIMVFDWELFLVTAASEPERFQPVLRGFAEISRRNLAAWAAEDIDLILIHDDIAMQNGPVFRPEWYRKYLFPLYEYLLEPVMDRADLKVAFVSDGYYTPLLGDLASVGFDGFIINECMDLGQIARRYGEELFLIGNVDTSVLTFGTPEDVEREVGRCLEEARPAGGHFLRAVGDLPHNIPLDNIRAYFDSAARLSRTSR
jgi:uroporphyrinogen decarboxylase